MKTHVLRKLIPLFALVLAIGLAFASPTESAGANDTLVQGYIFQNNVCTAVATQCSDTGTAICTYNSQPVKGMIGTSCVQTLYRP